MPGKKQTGAEEGGGGGEMGVGGWKGGGKRWRKDYIVPRTGHSVYELPQSLSRFQRLSPSFFFLAVSVVFGERRRLASPPIRAHTLSPSLSLFFLCTLKRKHLSSLFGLLPSVAFLISPAEWESYLRKIWVGHPECKGCLDSFSGASASKAKPPAVYLYETVYVVQTMSSAPLLPSCSSSRTLSCFLDTTNRSVLSNKLDTVPLLPSQGAT